MRIPIVHEDDQLIVINKPAGLLSVPDRYDAELPNALTQIGQRYGEVRPIHRLDRETSGLLSFARSQDAQRSLSQQFEQRQVTKTYLAIIEGTPPIETGEIDFPLGPHPGKPGQMIVSNRGKEARTVYRVLETLGRFSLLEVKIFTGRTHQIRVHLAAIGTPLVVDQFYGQRKQLKLSEIKGRRYRANRTGEERPLLSRHPLHAYTLGFLHPTSGEELQWECEPPKDMRATINQLQKWG
ncbi:MAG: RluA family pseudouridine synthase [Bacteroidota bacterium]